MANRFEGFPQEGIAFLRGLERNNNREWFQARKQIYEEKVKAPTLALADALNARLMEFAADHVTDPPKALFRIYRDTRFSKDKSPYKTNTAARFSRRGADDASAGYYFELSPAHLGIAAGLYMPSPRGLLAVRNAIAERYEEFQALLQQKSLRKLLGPLQGDKLSRPPKGFPKDHPAEELLRHKHWYYWVELEPAFATAPRVVTEIAKRFRAAAPVVTFFNRALGYGR